MLESLGLPATTMQALVDVCHNAGRDIMDVFHSPSFEHKLKSDNSPVTEADERAEKIILPVLKNLNPTISIVAEESFAAGQIPDIPNTGAHHPFWLVDPIDGTKEFMNKRQDFTVNIALIVDRAPVLGIVHCPALDMTYLADETGASFQIDAGGLRTPLNVNKASSEWRIVGSKSHRTAETDQYLQKVPVKEFVSRGSSLKFCMVASGDADFYPRLGPTMEWDTAAGDAVLRGAGGYVLNMDGSTFTYGKTGFKNPFFLAAGGIEKAQIPTQS